MSGDWPRRFWRRPPARRPGEQRRLGERCAPDHRGWSRTDVRRELPGTFPSDSSPAASSEVECAVARRQRLEHRTPPGRPGFRQPAVREGRLQRHEGVWPFEAGADSYLRASWRAGSREPASPSTAFIPAPWPPTSGRTRPGSRALCSRRRNSSCSQPEQGAERIVYLAASPEVEGETGGYYDKNKRVEPSALARDETIAARLWEESVKLTQPVS